MIEVKNISKTFKEKQVLFDISGTFLKGKNNLIIGSSGTEFFWIISLTGVQKLIRQRN